MNKHYNMHTLILVSHATDHHSLLYVPVLVHIDCLPLSCTVASLLVGWKFYIDKLEFGQMLGYFCVSLLFVCLNHCLFYYHIRSCLYRLGTL